MGVKFVRINHRRWVFLAALAGLAVYASKTQMDADTDRLRQIEANAVNEAMVSALGVDPWRGTSIGTLVRQREEAAAASQAEEQAEEQMTLMMADSDGPSEASDEEPTVEEIASNGVASAEPLSDLFLTNFSVVDGGVQFDFELDSTNSVDTTVEMFSTTNLTAGVWNHEISDPIPAGVTNHTTFIAWPSALIPQAFYTYGWPTDSDGDGLIDLYELLVTGTDPNNADTDGDGLSDGREIAMGTDPSVCDSEYLLGPVETTDTPGPDFRMEGSFDVHVEFSGLCTSDFSVKGISPPGGSNAASNLSYQVNGPGHRNAFELVATGGVFRALKTGFFSFQVAADDYARINIGDQFVEALYPESTPSPVLTMLMVSNLTYSVSMNSYNVGGPAEVKLLKWGEFLPVEKPRLSLRAAPDVLIYEPPYRNSDEEPLHDGGGTEAVVRLSVCGGEFGGTLRVFSTNLSKLECSNGEQLPIVIEILPHETKTWCSSFAGTQGCCETNEISIVAEFEENQTHEIIEERSVITPVIMTMKPLYEAPENTNDTRHVYGVGELVRFEFEPDLPCIELEAHGPDDNLVASFYGKFQENGIHENDNGRIYVCPIAQSNDRDVVVRVQGSEYRPEIQLVEPSEIICKGAAWNGVCWNFGEVGVASLITTNYVGPMNVSFQGIMVAEIPCTEIYKADGYFLTTNFVGSLSHGYAQSSNVAHGIKEGNYWCEDAAGTNGAYENWSSGYLIWKIPIGWMRKRFLTDDMYSIAQVSQGQYTGWEERQLLVGGADDCYQQYFSISDDGECVVHKFGHYTMRTRWCQIILDGRIIQWFH